MLIGIEFYILSLLFLPSLLLLVLVFYCCLTNYHRLTDWKNNIVLSHHSAGHNPGWGAHWVICLVSQSWNQGVSWLSSYPEALGLCGGAHSSCWQTLVPGQRSLFFCWLWARAQAQIWEAALRFLLPEDAPSLFRFSNKIPLSCQIFATSRLCVLITAIMTRQKQNNINKRPLCF